MFSVPIIAGKVVDDILTNRAGEGGTLWNIPKKTSGYVIGGRVPELVFSCDTSDTAIRTLVFNHFSAYRAAVRESDCVGWWHHKDHIYVDVNSWVADKETARALGVAQRQIAMWDIANKCGIAL